MGIAEFVRTAADAAAGRWLVSPRQLLLLEILRLMPVYRDAKTLPAWEDAFKGVWQDEESESVGNEILWDIFEFGMTNMYVAFDQAATRISAQYLRERLQARGIALPASEDMTTC